MRKPAYKEAGGDLIVLIDGSVQQRLLAPSWSSTPTCRVTAVPDLPEARTKPKTTHRLTDLNQFKSQNAKQPFT